MSIVHGRNLLAVLSQVKYRIVKCLSLRYRASALCFLLQNRICRFCLENKAYGQDWKCWLLSTREERRDYSSTSKQGKKNVSNRNADSAALRKG